MAGKIFGKKKTKTTENKKAGGESLHPGTTLQSASGLPLPLLLGAPPLKPHLKMTIYSTSPTKPITTR